MSCFNCDKCGRYEHISRMGEFTKFISMGSGNLQVKVRFHLCKWCLTYANIPYTVSKKDQWIEFKSKSVNGWVLE